MPFRLINAPATFKRTLNILLSGFNWRTCHVYSSIEIVFLKLFDTHLLDVKMVLLSLQKAGI